VTLRRLALIAAVALTLPLAAADGERSSTPPTPGDGRDSTEPQTDDATTEGDDSGGPSADVFVPTEEISEDAAVAFPVDI